MITEFYAAAAVVSAIASVVACFCYLMALYHLSKMKRHF
jgi:hypothetical protein